MLFVFKNFKLRFLYIAKIKNFELFSYLSLICSEQVLFLFRFQINRNQAFWRKTYMINLQLASQLFFILLNLN